MRARTLIKIGVVLLTTLLALLIASFALLYYKQKDVVQWAVDKANGQFTGKLTVTDSRISLFHDFPYVDIDLQGVAFYESKSVAEKPIYEIDHLYLGFRWMDILRSSFDVRLIDIEGGHCDVVQHTDGSINILLSKNLSKSEQESTDTTAFSIHLQKLVVKDFTLSYLQEVDSILIQNKIEKIETRLKLESEHLFLNTDLRTSLSISQKDVPTFFHDKSVMFTTDLDYSLDTKQLRLVETHLQLEEARYGIIGTIAMNDTTELNLKLAGEKPDFSLFTALAPPETAAILARYRNSGNVFFEGIVAGPLLPSKQPKIDFRFGCKNGFFENTASKKKVEDMNFSGSFTNGDSQTLTSSVFELTDFSVKPERGSFKGTLRVANFTDPQVAVTLASDIDLEFLGEFLGVENLQRLKGNVLLKMNFNEIIDFENPESSLEQLKKGIESELSVRGLSFIIPGYRHPIKKLDLHAEMQNGEVKMDTFALQISDSDLQLVGSISNLPALFHRQELPVSFKLGGQATRLNLTDLSVLDSTNGPLMDEELTDFKIKLAFETSVEKMKKAPLPWGEFYIEDLFAKVKGYPHTLHDIHADVIITDSTFQLKDFTGEIDNSDFHFNGKLTQYKIWFDSLKNGDTRFEFNLYSEQLRLDNLLTYKGENYLPEDYRHEVAKELRLHGLTDLNFKNSFRSADLMIDKVEARLNVHPLKVEKMKGRIHYEDEHLTVKDLSATMGNSDFTVNLNYYTGQDSLLRKRDNLFSIRARKLNLDELLAYQPSSKPKDHAKAFNIFEVPFTDMSFQADIGSVKHHQIDIANLKARVRTTTKHFLFVDTLSMNIAGGSFLLNGYLNGSDPKKIYFKSTTDFDQIDLDKLFIKFDNFGQDFLVNCNLHGQLSGEVKSLFHVHPDLTPILNEGEAHLDIAISKGSLVDFAPLQAMSSYFQDKNLRMVRFDTLQNKLDLTNGTLTIPAMTINSSLGFIEIAGTQSLDLKMDYLIRVPLQLVTQVGFRALFGGKRKEEVDPDQEDAIQYRDESKRTRFLNIRITGTPDNYSFSLGKRKKD